MTSSLVGTERKHVAIQFITTRIKGYWTHYKKPIAIRALHRSLGGGIYKLGLSAGSVLEELISSGTVHEIMIETGARFLMPMSAWIEMSLEDRDVLCARLEVMGFDRVKRNAHEKKLRAKQPINTHDYEREQVRELKETRYNPPDSPYIQENHNEFIPDEEP